MKFDPGIGIRNPGWHALFGLVGRLGSHSLHFDLANVTLLITDKANRRCQKFVMYAFFFRMSEIILPRPDFRFGSTVIIHHGAIREVVLNLQTPRCANAVDGGVTGANHGNFLDNFGKAF